MESPPPSTLVAKDHHSLVQKESVLQDLPERYNKGKTLVADREIKPLSREINKHPVTLDPPSHNMDLDLPHPEVEQRISSLQSQYLADIECAERMQRRIDAYIISRARVSSSMEPKRQSVEINKHSHALGPPFGDMDNKSTLKIDQDVNIPVPYHKTNDFKKQKSQIMKRLGDIDRKLPSNSIEDDHDLHPLASLTGDMKIDPKSPLESEKLVNGRLAPLLANSDRVQEIRRNIKKCLSDITTSPASKIDDNRETCETEQPPHSRSHLQTPRDKLEQERTDLTLLRAAWIQISISLTLGRVWNGLDEQQKAAYNRAVRFRARSLIPHPGGHWHEIQKFAARIFAIIKKLRAVANSESADLRAILLEAASSRILPLEECKRMQLRVFNIGNEQQPMPESASITANDLLPFDKVEYKWCLKPQAELAPTPAGDRPEETTEGTKLALNIQPNTIRQENVPRNVYSWMDATAKVSQEPRKLWGPEISPGFIQEPTNKGTHHAGLTKSTGVPPRMAAQVDYQKSGTETVQDIRVNNAFINYQNKIRDEARTADKNGKAELDVKSIDPRNKAISHQEPITAELTTAKSVAHVNQKLDDRTEREDGLAALIKANKKFPSPPWCLKFDGRFYKRTSSQPTLMHKRLLCYGLSTETICKLVTQSAQGKNDPIPLTPFRHGVLCVGTECNLPKFMINGEPYELFDIKGKDNKPILQQFDWGTHKLLQPIGVSEAMEMKKDPNQKVQDLLTSPYDWNVHDVDLRQFPTWNHANTKLFQTPKAPKEESAVLSYEAQNMMDEARQKALSARALVVGSHEQVPQTKTNSHDDLMIARKLTQAIEMTIRNRHARGEARANALTLADWLAASGENNSALSSDSMPPVFQRVVQDSGADPVLSKPDNDKPMGHAISSRPRHPRISKLKTDTHTQAENFDNIAVQRLERWGYSKPVSPVTEKSTPSTVISATATEQKAHAASDQKLSKPANPDVVNNADTNIEVANAEIHTADKSIVQDFSAITDPTQKESEIQKLIKNPTKGSDDILLTEAKFPTGPIENTTLTLGVHSSKEVQSTDAGVKFEDDWIMADDDEAEEWEML
ncbi:hypothetical protein DSL72_006857 [Monilinia vaccinii-corymbosi]|uniref:Uncharacterized protein n=1 Tax=Monilinia vaccinii-corymbosi TaxID=61207 RepID=A0A8A3PL73_9HELO|nr:hypothetical protein DSL72_006857 [Monilinia vaccinii-corymbosi]